MLKLQKQAMKHPRTAAVLAGMIAILGGSLIQEILSTLQWVSLPTAKVVTTCALIVSFVLVILFLYLRVTGHLKLTEDERQQPPEVGKAVVRSQEEFSRFEDIEQALRERKLRYGFVKFFPTCEEEKATTLGAKGPGIQLLEKIFGSKLPEPSRRRNWSDLFYDLKEDGKHKIHICATPLYETRERREDVAFSLPLFYADIGLFVRPGNERIPSSLLENAGNNTFIQVKNAINENVQKSLYVQVVENELQQKMFARHFPHIRQAVSNGQFDVATAIPQLLATPGTDEYTDLLFCERIQVVDNGNDKVVNLLKPGQLLFPVCYAMRKGEDTLRQYVNLRLLSIDGTELPDKMGQGPVLDPDSFSGVMRVLEDAAENILATPSDFRRYYRRHYQLAAPEADNVVPINAALEGGHSRA